MADLGTMRDHIEDLMGEVSRLRAERDAWRKVADDAHSVMVEQGVIYPCECDRPLCKSMRQYRNDWAWVNRVYGGAR